MNYHQDEIGQYVYFGFKGDYIELKFDTPQDMPYTGWTIRPYMPPCRVSTCITIMYMIMCVSLL